jgi:hypothetical protein
MAKRVAKKSGRTSSGTTRRTGSARGSKAPGRTTTKSRSAATTGFGRRPAAPRRGSTSARSASRTGGGAAYPLFDREDIRRWAEERGAVPTCVRGTGRRNDMGMIRLEFPRFGEEPKLQPINWDQWFEKFDQNGLALLVQDETGSGEKSNFNKLVKRSTVAAKAKPKVRGAH